MKTLYSYVWITLVLLSAVTLFGCALVMGDKMVGIESGRFFYSDGVLKADYRAPFDRVWAASEKAVADMKAIDVDKKKKIGIGTINGVVGDEKIRIDLDYVSRDVTSVGVRAGMAGNNLASQLIHQKIRDNLLKK